MALGGSKLVWLTGLGFFFSTFWFTFRNQGDKLDNAGLQVLDVLLSFTPVLIKPKGTLLLFLQTKPRQKSHPKV